MKKSSVVKTKIAKLDPYQEIALANIDAMKEEMVNMVRKKRDSGKDSFELTPEKANKMHDDRAYVLALAAYALQEARRSHIVNKKRDTKTDLVSRLPIRKGKLNKMIG